MRRRWSAVRRCRSTAGIRRARQRHAAMAHAGTRVANGWHGRRAARPDPCSAGRRVAADCRDGGPAMVAITDRLPGRGSGRPVARASGSCDRSWRTRSVRDGGGAAGAPRLRYSQSGVRLQRDCGGGRSVVGASRARAVFVQAPAARGAGQASHREHAARDLGQRKSAGVSTSRTMPGSSTSSSLTGALANSARAPVSPSSAASAS